MSARSSHHPLVAVDVGNSRVKLGWFDAPTAPQSETHPCPTSTLELHPRQPDWSALAAWIDERSAGSHDVRGGAVDFVIGSVQRAACERIVEWLGSGGARWRRRVVSHVDLPLRVELPEPQRVGVDRLLAAVAVNRLRPPASPALVIDLGSAITVDWITAQGAFAGGAILPGIGMSAQALHEQTDALPLLATRILDRPPEPLGKSTTEAIESGLFWGAVGGMQEVARRISDSQGQRPAIFLTGGAAPAVARYFSDDAQFAPHLVLGGIALVALQEGFWR
jgi:type III pantothenate kinase